MKGDRCLEMIHVYHRIQGGRREDISISKPHIEIHQKNSNLKKDEKR